MPKRLIKRLLPDYDVLRNHKHLQLFGTLLHDANLWHLNRHSASGAFAVGLFMAFIPLPFQMIFAAGAAILFRVNLPLSVCLVWITNPITIPPIFLFAYLLGAWIIGQPAEIEPVEFSFAWLQHGGIESIWLPLIVGCMVFAMISGLLGYSLMLLIWRWRAIEKWKKRQQSRRPVSPPDSTST
ncbi:MAG: DUF2062 domain-containing protein [Candidatus Thiodiazotropha sp.]|jgi:uncharacterized protein